MPLFKSGTRSHISNCRGMAKTTTIPKPLEKIITDLLYHKILPFISVVMLTRLSQLSMKDIQIKCRLLLQKLSLVGFSKMVKFISVIWAQPYSLCLLLTSP